MAREVDVVLDRERDAVERQAACATPLELSGAGFELGAREHMDPGFVVAARLDPFEHAGDDVGGPQIPGAQPRAKGLQIKAIFGAQHGWRALTQDTSLYTT